MTRDRAADLKRAFVIGHPISHSRSPALHSHWLARHRISGRYEAINIAPDDLAQFIADLRKNGYVGGNVTLPHKETVAGLVDEQDDSAIQIGAVNTLWFDDDRLIGGNTDGFGFVANLDDQAPNWDEAGTQATALILGAGGAARAVAVALAQRRIGRIAIANRTVERAEAICNHCADLFPATTFQSSPWQDRTELLAQTGILVNTTSLGMAGQATLDLSLDRLHPQTVVNDLVYNPLETNLLAGARARGNRIVDGLGMLLHQAAPGFERWFGVKPVVDAALRNAVLNA
ncbi:MAG: shikimate dehydrogenase [Pseudomonadota bacterium]